MNIKLHEAIKFATIKHNGQVRKGTAIPYIVHPVEVMQILLTYGASENVVVAGVLHDTLEDTDTTIDEIKQKFGENVAQLVASESEDKSKTWEERKQATIDALKNATLDVKLVCLADKLSNLRSIYSDYQLVGDKLWDRFNRSKKQIACYYIQIAKATADIQGVNNIYSEYVSALNSLCNIVFGLSYAEVLQEIERLKKCFQRNKEIGC